jgi:hypothetical protein
MVCAIHLTWASLPTLGVTEVVSYRQHRPSGPPDSYRSFHGAAKAKRASIDYL